MPLSGGKVPEAGHQNTIREVIFQGYRIVYRAQDEHQRVQIVTVLHGARDLAGMEPPWQQTPEKKP